VIIFIIQAILGQSGSSNVKYSVSHLRADRTDLKHKLQASWGCFGYFLWSFYEVRSWRGQSISSVYSLWVCIIHSAGHTLVVQQNLSPKKWPSGVIPFDESHLLCSVWWGHGGLVC